jgi:Domain of unknown function (DUF4337)
MEEARELPHANDPFEKRVAWSIAVAAVILSIISMWGDHAKTTAIIRTNESSDQWEFYQAKSIKKHIVESENHIIDLLKSGSKGINEAGPGETREKEKTRYDEELKEIKAKAEELSGEARHEILINQRCDLGELILQVTIVLFSAAILSHWKKLWILGIITSLAGVLVGISVLFV